MWKVTLVDPVDQDTLSQQFEQDWQANQAADTLEQAILAGQTTRWAGLIINPSLFKTLEIHVEEVDEGKKSKKS